MKAIFSREMRGYFTTPIGYIFLSVFYFFAGFYFARGNLLQNSSNLTGVFSNLFTICIFLIPLLTMRLLSEDRKNKTDQLTLTAPVSLFALVMGKFLAAFAVFAAGTSALLLQGLLLAYLGCANWSMIVGHLTGLLLLGSALISIGMFISSLTENQIVAAVGGIAAGLFLIMADSAASMVQGPAAKMILTLLSFNRHYTKFTQSILNLPDVIFFLSVTAVFVFFTIRTFERRRWR